MQHVSPLRGWRRVELRRELIEPYLLEISVGRFLLDLGMAQLTGAREEWRELPPDDVCSGLLGDSDPGQP